MSFYVNLFKESFPSSLSSEVDLILHNILFKSGFLTDYRPLIEQYHNLNIISVKEGEPLEPVSKYDERMEDKFSVMVDSEKVSIPQRVYFSELTPLNSDFLLTSLQKNMIACILTRHCDGFVREYFLKKIILLDESWVAPFVMQLVSEYVEEILEIIYNYLPQMNLSTYQKFIQDNPKYFELTKARIVSYWDCYYRSGQEKESYVGFKILRYFETHQ